MGQQRSNNVALLPPLDSFRILMMLLYDLKVMTDEEFLRQINYVPSYVLKLDNMWRFGTGKL